MVEATLAQLGTLFATLFSLSKKNIGYTERDQLFYFLSKNEMPITLPGIVYGCIDIARRTDSFHAPSFMAKGGTNLNFTSISQYNIFPVTLTVNVALISAKMTDYFNQIKNYFRLWDSTNLEVNFASDEFKGPISANILDISSLSTPQSAEEGKDFDRGRFYISEGTLTIGTYLVIPARSVKLITKILVDWQVTFFKEGDIVDDSILINRETIT